ncbi:MAG: hypothetical protein ABJD07_01680 [Gemmatimonadaceae bacterium]
MTVDMVKGAWIAVALGAPPLVFWYLVPKARDEYEPGRRHLRRLGATGVAIATALTLSPLAFVLAVCAKR